jgi:hypothetical protein
MSSSSSYDDQVHDLAAQLGSISGGDAKEASEANSQMIWFGLESFSHLQLKSYSKPFVMTKRLCSEENEERATLFRTCRHSIAPLYHPTIASSSKLLYK